MRRVSVAALAVLLAACSVAPAAGAATGSAQPTAGVIASGDLSAQYFVSLGLPQNLLYDDGMGQWYWDGLVQNPQGSSTNIEFPSVSIEYHSVSETVLGGSTSWVYCCWVLAPSGQAAFHQAISLPAGYSHAHTSAGGNSTSAPYEMLSNTIVTSGLGDHGWRWMTLHITNPRTHTVVGVWPNVYETMDLGGGAQWWDVMAPVDAFQQRLAPGESVDVMVWGKRPYWGGASAGSLSWSTGRAAPASSPVYRFYNKKMGTHFYTIDPSEKAWVQAKLAWLYDYEGVAYQAYQTSDVNEKSLYRFYNKKTGTHFYTADAAERNDVIAKLSWLYDYEGIAYHICDSGGLATNTMFRFYNKRTGTHFYTIDPTERDNVIAKLGWLYNYEGPAFHVPKPSGGSI